MQDDGLRRRSRIGLSLLTAGLLAFCVVVGSALAPLPETSATATEKDPHADLLAETSYPTAAQCASCHGQIYAEWASSNHAYASISPMFHKFEQAINDLSSGTIGGFCVRCHQQVGTQRGEERCVRYGSAARSRARASPASRATASRSSTRRPMANAASCRATSTCRSRARAKAGSLAR